MITFLVLNIIMTIVTACAAIVVTIALSIWTAIVDINDCISLDDSCVCQNETYSGKIIKNTVTIDLCACYS